jgi:SH3-like domain-containing protein
MTLARPLFRWLLTLTLLGPLLATTATALTMVSVDRPEINMRDGAGTRHDALWKLSRGYPLQVLARKQGWLRVRDFEGDTGWVLGRLTARKPHMVVKVPRANLRRQPGTQHRRVGQAVYGEVLRTLDRRGDWVRVRQADGTTGWVARRLLWGW